MNSHILFFIFFTLSVIHPVDIPNINLYIAMGLFSLIGVIFLITLYKNRTWKKLLEKYKLEIFAISLFLLINIISTYINYETFNHSNNLFRFTLPSIAVWLLFPMTWVIYTENNNEKLQWLGWTVFIILGLVALWQLIDIESAYQLVKYSIGGFIHPYEYSNGWIKVAYITSLTHLQNEYANIAAIAILVLITRILRKSSTTKKNSQYFILHASLILLLFITGALTGARIFAFIFLFAGIIYTLKYFTVKPVLVTFLIFSALITTHLLISSGHYTMFKYKHIFPYLTKIDTNEKFVLSDFIPKISNKSLNGRENLWKKGIQTWEDKKWLGIGAGGFRADSKNSLNGELNLHNYFLQVLVETGIIGFTSIFLLFFLLIRRSFNSKNEVVLLAILSSMLFDNLLDYSSVYVITICWLLTNSYTTKTLNLKP